MKIKTIPAFFNKSVKIFDSTEVKFDHTGTLEVDNKVGKALLEKYPEFMFELDRKEDTKKTPEQEYTKEVVQRLESELFDAKKQINELKDSKGAVEVDLEAWQGKVQEYINKIKQVENSLEQEKLTNQKVVEKLELKITLIEMTAEQLKGMATDAKFPKEEWEKKSKSELVEYILNKSE